MLSITGQTGREEGSYVAEPGHSLGRTLIPMMVTLEKINCQSDSDLDLRCDDLFTKHMFKDRNISSFLSQKCGLHQGTSSKI